MEPFVGNLVDSIVDAAQDQLFYCHDAHSIRYRPVRADECGVLGSAGESLCNSSDAHLAEQFARVGVEHLTLRE